MNSLRFPLARTHYTPPPELYSMLVELRDLLRKCEDRSKIPHKALQMYLSVCKLLDMALIIPAKMIPDFQVTSALHFIHKNCSTLLYFSS